MIGRFSGTAMKSKGGYLTPECPAQSAKARGSNTRQSIGYKQQLLNLNFPGSKRFILLRNRDGKHTFFKPCLDFRKICVS